MKKHLPILLMVIFTGLAFAGFVRMATSQAPVDQPLTLTSISPDEVEAGRPFELSLEGEGLTGDIRVSVAIDAGNLWSLVGFMDTWALVQDIALNGDLAIIANHYRGMLVADISNADHPEVVSSLPLPGNSFSVATEDDVAYFALAGDGIAAVDYADAKAPRLLQHVPTPGVAWEVAIGTDTLCVAAGREGLIVLDRDDGAGLAYLADLPLEGRAVGLDVQGDVAFVAAMEEGLVLVDLSRPRRPQVLSRFSLPAPIGTVTVEGSVAYLTDRRGGLHIVDVADRVQPRLLSYTPLTGRLEKPRYQDGLLYVPGSPSGLQVLDVRSPESPLVLGSIMLRSVRNVALRGDRAFLAHSGYQWSGGKQGVYVVDLKRIAPLQMKGHHSSQGEAKNLNIIDGVGYLADGSAGLRIIDLFSPDSEGELGILDVGEGNVTDVFVAEGLAYMADWHRGFIVADVSDPSAPHLLSTTQTFGAAKSVVVEDGRAYVLCGDRGSKGEHNDVRGVQIFDVADPGSPKLLGGIETGGASSLLLQGKMAFLAGHLAGLMYLDLNDPAHPVVVGKTTIPWPEGHISNAKDLARKGDILYVAYGLAGLLAMDVSTPEQPAVVGQFRVEGGVFGVTLDGDRAYLACNNDGVVVVDISDPRHIRETAHLKASLVSRSTTVIGNELLLHNRNHGVLVLPKPLEGEMLEDEDGRISARFAGIDMPGRYSVHLYRGDDEAELIGSLVVTGSGL